MSNRIWRILIWAAVSSKPQAGDDKESLPEQERAGHAFAESVGGTVVDTLRVPGHSRNYVFWDDVARDVPAYQQLREHCDRADFDVLWCRSVDRLGRKNALSEQVIALVEDIMGGEVFVQDSPHVLGNKGSGQRFMESVQGAASDTEMIKLRARHRMGMRGRVKRGLAACHWPHGYDPVRDANGEVIGGQFNEGIEAVRLSTSLYLRGWSTKRIAKELNKRGYPTKSGGRRWYQNVVWRMLHNDFYAGRPSWGSEQREERSDKYPALWDEQTWHQLIRERETRRRHQHHKEGSSPFLDVAFCARCQGRMTMYSKWEDGELAYRWLLCSLHKQDSAMCHRNSIRLERVFAQTLAWLQENLDPAIYALNVGPEPGQMEKEDLESVEKQIGEIEERRTRLGHRLAAGTIETEIYTRVDSDLVEQLGTLKREVDRLRQFLSAVPDRAARRAELEKLAGEPGLGLLSLPWPEINSSLLRLGLRLEIEEGEIARLTFV